MPTTIRRRPGYAAILAKCRSRAALKAWETRRRWAELGHDKPVTHLILSMGGIDAEKARRFRHVGDLKAFAATWSRNLEAQGFLSAAGGDDLARAARSEAARKAVATRRLRRSAEILGVPLLDHVIIGGRDKAEVGGKTFFSFREGGLL